MTSHIQDLSFDIKIIHLFYRVIMAVLKSLPGIEVATEKKFSIQLSVGNPYKYDYLMLGFDLRVDGERVFHPFLGKVQYLKQGSG